MKNKHFFHHSNSRFFKISGKDSETFIQNLITNDITKCKNRSIIYSCLLTPQGKFLADFFIFNLNGIYIFETHNKFYKNLLGRLKIYKLRSNIEIEEVNDLFSYSVFNISYDSHNIILLNDPRNANLGKKLIINDKISLVDKKISEISETEYHEILIATTTAFIISVVKSSLALSLGLVGALSIIRFRTAIKEPEELSYIFIAITIGIGLGANQVVITLIAFILTSVVILLLFHFSDSNIPDQNMFLT